MVVFKSLLLNMRCDMKPVISSENVVWLLSQDPTATLAEMTGGVK